MTDLYRIDNGSLIQAPRKTLSREAYIENWVTENPRLLGLDAIIVGRQVRTAHGNRIDLLALDQAGDVTVIELKRDQTPRDIVAQTLDYASWVGTLTTVDIHRIANEYCSDGIQSLYRNHFGDDLPDQLNNHHSMLIVASVLDESTRRIVEYLSEQHGVPINTVFFEVFEADGQEWLATNFLLDQEEVKERTERKTSLPWSGFYFVNNGEGQHRSWKDMVKYGFIGAGHGVKYSRALDLLQIGDRIFAYHRGAGYVGYGIVTSEKQPAGTFQTVSGPLLDQQLAQSGMRENANDPELTEYVVGVDWKNTVDPASAVSFNGMAVLRNVVGRLRESPTVSFLREKFNVGDE